MVFVGFNYMFVFFGLFQFRDGQATERLMPIFFSPLGPARSAQPNWLEMLRFRLLFGAGWEEKEEGHLTLVLGHRRTLAKNLE